MQAARGSLASFCEFVGRDEKTDEPIQLAPFHVELLDFVQANRLAVCHLFVESGKSALVSVLRTLWLLGRDPSARIVIVSSSAEQARRVLRSIAKYLTTSAELREVFPRLRPSKSGPWRDDALTVERRGFAKDASCIGVGVHGNVVGARCDHLVLDDLDDRESTTSEYVRRETASWVRSSAISRMTRDASAVVVATPWHQHDVASTLAAGGWPLLVRGIVDERGASRWPSRFPPHVIKQKRDAIANAFEAARVLDCRVRDDAASVFQQAWVEHAQTRGRGLPLLSHLFSRGPRVVVGVDLASSKRRGADKSAFAVVAAHANGDRELLHLESAQLHADEIVRTIVRLHAWFSPSSVVVESNGVQAFVSQLVRSATAIPIVGFNTGQGVMSLRYQADILSTEFANGKWILRDPDSPEVAGLASDLLFYSGSRCPDRMSALLLARWGCEQGEQRVEFFNPTWLRR